MDSFSSSVESIERYNHAIVFVDAATGYRWLYGMKTKDDAIKLAPSDVARMRTFPGKRDSMRRYTVRCDTGGVRTQQVLRQDGTVCQTAGAVVCDSRPAVAAPPSRHVELEP